MKTRIYLDMDGVITDLVWSAMNYWEAPLFHEGMYPDDCGWNVVKATNICREERGLRPLESAEFWDGLDYGFWRNLVMYPQAPEFIEYVEQFGEVYLATSPTLSSECVAGKFDWVKENLPQYSRRLIITADKTPMAGSRTVLIDDRDRNCSRFEAAGGLAVLFPRPWNDRGYCPTPYQKAKEELASICS
jgi:5'(3')-deoxyribonucleotidase